MLQEYDATLVSYNLESEFRKIARNNTSHNPLYTWRMRKEVLSYTVQSFFRSVSKLLIPLNIKSFARQLALLLARLHARSSS